MVASMQAAGMPQQAQDVVVKYGWFRRTFESLIQLAEENPGVVPLQTYLQKVRDWWKKKTGDHDEGG